MAPLCSGATVSFAQPDAMRGTLKDTLEVRKLYDIVIDCFNA